MGAVPPRSARRGGGASRTRGRAEARGPGDQRSFGRRLLAGRTAAGGALPVDDGARRQARARAEGGDRAEVGARTPRRSQRRSPMSGAPSAPVAALARAKVNLYLHVVGWRPDGYHLLDSLVVFADAGDRVEVSPAESLRLAIDGPFATEVPAGDDNLVLRAARALAEAADEPRAGATIRLTKSLPVASGIGGGSADAAATLRALVRSWRVD